MLVDKNKLIAYQHLGIETGTWQNLSLTILNINYIYIFSHIFWKMDFKRNSIGSGSDDPPLSRLFIIGPKTLTEEEYRSNFDAFGHIDEIWMVKDKNTGEHKGRQIFAIPVFYRIFDNTAYL